MSTSRKVKAKLARQRRSARKSTSTEAVQKEPEPEPTERSTAESQAATQRGTVTASSALTGTQFVCFCNWLSAQKLFAGLSLFTCTFQRGTEADNAGNLSGPPACATETFLGSRRIFTWFFYPAFSGPKKRERQSTADPDSEMMSSSDSDSSSTVDISTLEGEDEKDFILPDYPSDELTSSELSDLKPEEGKNLSTGWSERVTRVDTQFHGDHVGPKISQTTSTTRAPHFPCSSFSSMPISGGCCAAKRTCEPSRSRSPSPLHTTPRILSLSLSLS